MERNILSVFVASPSDLSDERNALRDIVERLNKIYGKRIGWQIELLGWEDTLPGFSRPQALINKDVENCELFIGMLWKRWGTDSGEYSSGFEEEYSIARSRRLNDGRPEIWMLFKRIEDELFEDPGEQLKKVVHFQSQLKEDKELLFKEFEDINAFRDVAYDNLSAYLLEIYSSIQKTSSKLETEPPISKAIPNIKQKQLDSQDNKNDELTDVFTKIGEYLGDGRDDEIDYWCRIRAYLTTSTLFSQSHIGELFGTHETNLVYRKRYEWNLSYNEIWFLMRTYFGDFSGVIPGWYWLSGKDVTEIDNILFYYSQNDRNSAVRRGALAALNYSNTTPSLEVISYLLKDDDDEIVTAAIGLTKDCKEKAVLGLLEPLLTHKNEKIKNVAIFTYIDLLYLFDPKQSFIFLKEKSSEVTSVYKASLESLDLKVRVDLLVSAVFEAAPRVREYAADYLYRIDALTADISEKILLDTDSFVRKIGFIWLINNGREFSLSEISKLFPKPEARGPSLLAVLSSQVTEDDIIPLVLTRMKQEQLEDMVDFYTQYGKEAYEALVTSHFSTIAEKIRSDLRNNLEDIKRHSIDKLKERYGDNASSSILAQYKPDIEQFIKDSFTEIALKGLSLLNDKSDIQFARQYLGKLKYNLGEDECISLIERYGDHSDIDSLINLAKLAYGDIRRKAVIVAIKLSENHLKLIQDLVYEKDIIIAQIAAEQIYLLSREDRISIANKLLYSEHVNVRLLAAKILSKDLGRNELESILNTYIESQTYYYNVVNFIDGFLYAPGKFKNKFNTTN